MEIRHLEYFMTVCETLNFTKAADRLNISQPSLSVQIRILENNIGAQLFQRIGKKIYITQSGEVLLRHAQRIFSEMEQAKNKINQLQNSTLGRITLGCPGSYLLHSAVSSFHEQFPDVEISLIDKSMREVINGTLNNEFDIGIAILPMDEPQLEYKLLMKTEFTLVVSTKHELAEVSSIKLKNLQSIPLNLLPKNYFSRIIIDKFLQKSGITLKLAMELSELPSLLQMTILNKGATLLPVSYIESLVDNRVKQISIEDPFPLHEIGIIYRKNNLTSPLLKTFVEFLIRHFQEQHAI